MTFKRIADSLVTRLILFGVLLVVFGAVARHYVLAQFLREDLTQVISAQQVTLARYVAHEIDFKIEERRRMLEHLSNELPRPLLAKPELLRDWLKLRHDAHPLFSEGFLVADAAGKVLADYPLRIGRAGSSLPDDPNFRDLRDGHRVIGRAHLDPATQQGVLPMGVPLKDRAGNLLALLIGRTALAAPGFLDHLQEGRIGETGGFLLVSPRDNLFVVASDPVMTLLPTPPPGRNLLHDRAMEGFRGSGVTVNEKGIEEIAAIAAVPSAGWFVVARLPTAEALGTVERVQAFIVRHGFVATLLVLFGASLIIVRMLRPLYRAASQAERMTRGEIPLEPLPVHSSDEVGHLTAAFNRLLAKLTGSQAELQRLAHHDPLTGLPNRSLLADRMQQALARGKRNATWVAVLFLDLDGFKPINDELGHEAGDEALRQIARRLQGVVRQADTLARVGGDEFVIVATDFESPAEHGVRTLASKCIEAVAQPLRLQGRERRLGVSIGIAVCEGACDADRLLVAADEAMYQAKSQGGGRYVMAPACTEIGAMGTMGAAGSVDTIGAG